jgi:calcium-translocating P-type ATPase
VRHLPAVEALGSTTVICCDKTGTLTKNQMSVRAVYLDGHQRTPAELAAPPALIPACTEFFLTLRHCHNLHAVRHDGARAWLGDPMEAALVEFADRSAPTLPTVTRIEEIPFDTDRKRMSVIVAAGTEHRLLCKGALETVLPTCSAARSGTTLEPITDSVQAEYQEAERRMAQAGLRVLAIAAATLGEDERVATETRLTLCGLVGLEDPPRAEVAPAIASCREAGIRVVMVTGDHPHTALAIAREIDLVRGPAPAVITGEQLHHISPAQLQLALDAPEILFARVTADQKLHIVEAMKKKGETVAVTGDGVNDAPALKTADIGIAMGITGTDVAKEAADIVLLDDNFATIVSAIEEGRSVYDNIRKFLTYILTSNIPELVPYLAFVLFRIPLPLTIIQILAVDLGTDMVPALALGAERPDPAVMRRPPRPRAERLLHWPLILRAYLFLGILQATGAMAAFFYVLHGAGWRYGETLARTDPVYLQATTACLATIIVMQVVNVFLCRHPRRSAFAFSLWNNRLLWLGIATEIALILAIVHTPLGQGIFGTAELPAEVWLVAVVFALAMLAIEELRKWIARSLSSGSAAHGGRSIARGGE